MTADGGSDQIPAPVPITEIGLVGLGRMGANLARRWRRSDIVSVAYDRDADAVASLSAEGAIRPTSDLRQLVASLARPRAVWIMVPAEFVDDVIDELAGHLEPGDVVIDGGNSHFVRSRDRADRLSAGGIAYVDVGTSGGVWGLERGYCLMVGGPEETVQRLEPVFVALAPGVAAATRTPGRDAEPSASERGWLHCGPTGAGHFVKMVHNGIEYAMMAAYAEGFSLMARAGIGLDPDAAQRELAPEVDPARYSYQLDLGEIAEVWRRGSVVESWLLDLTAQALLGDPELSAFDGRVGDSGEGRWAMQAGIETGTPLPTFADALFDRFSSRGNADITRRLLSAMRAGFGGHLEPPGGER